MENERRRFLAATAVLGIGTLVPTAGLVRANAQPKDEKKEKPRKKSGPPRT